MKVWVFVEGESDKIALNALWSNWRERLGNANWGIHIIPLNSKSNLLKKIGPHTAEKLANNNDDLVVGLPDLYPNAICGNPEYRHANLDELKSVQCQLVKRSLESTFSIRGASAVAAMDRFHPTALKHDLETLLLASINELRNVLGTTEALGKWRHPVEEQNQTKPPKFVVEELFRTKRRQRYRDTIDARTILSQVRDIKNLLYNAKGQLECPVFKETMDWIGEKTGCAGY